MNLKRWKTKNTFIDESGDVYLRKDKDTKDNIRWFKYDFVDIQIINSKTSAILEEEYKDISEKHTASHKEF